MKYTDRTSTINDTIVACWNAVDELAKRTTSVYVADATRLVKRELEKVRFTLICATPLDAEDPVTPPVRKPKYRAGDIPKTLEVGMVFSTYIGKFRITELRDDGFAYFQGLPPTEGGGRAHISNTSKNFMVKLNEDFYAPEETKPAPVVYKAGTRPPVVREGMVFDTRGNDPTFAKLRYICYRCKTVGDYWFVFEPVDFKTHAEFCSGDDVLIASVPEGWVLAKDFTEVTS